MGPAMYRAGLRLGKEARAIVDRDDTLGMAKAWDIIYGVGSRGASRLVNERFVITRNPKLENRGCVRELCMGGMNYD